MENAGAHPGWERSIEWRNKDVLSTYCENAIKPNAACLSAVKKAVRAADFRPHSSDCSTDFALWILMLDVNKVIEVDRYVSSRSIAQELKIDHRTVLSHLSKAEFKKKLYVWVPHKLTPKNTMGRISICEALDKRNEIDPFLKRMVTGEEKWVIYDNVVRKRSWSKRGEAAQTVAKPGLTSGKVLLYIWWDWK
ncbi:histone-lysine N-methyltransferase SETMAR [Trichonephila clavipes]|nr:histone-lysine N-methyltransferase SETMAR [Trichonephila clavipes]